MSRSLAFPTAKVDQRCVLGPVATQPRTMLPQSLRTTRTEPLKRAPFPTEAVRDLLGITRALYRAELALPPPKADKARVDRLEKIGKQYRQALDLGTKCEPDTMGGRAAVSWAEKATAGLGEFVGEEMLVGPMVRATVARMRGAR